MPLGLSSSSTTMKIFHELCCMLPLMVGLMVKAARSACPSACFCDMSASYISCVGDGLWQVPPDIPAAVSRLELRNYIVTTLSGENIGYLSNLTELKLQQTQIQLIDNGTFENLSFLERLDLSQNIMENVSTATFLGLVSLKYLDLSSNRLACIVEAFTDLVNVEQLNLRDNEIPQLTRSSFTGLNKVQYLNLDSNRISSIDVGTFQYLINLVHLILSNNPLTTLTRLDFFSSRLLYIDASHVGLVQVPQSLTQVVRDLRLAKNNLTHIHLGDFDSYPHLGLLVLDDNYITDIENDALGRQESLLRLWLNGNQLRRVPANLPPTLRTLYIEENQLEVLPAYSFQGLTNVEQLFLQRNRLHTLAPCAFCDLTSLHSLDLQANQIENLTEGVFQNLSKLHLLDLSQNRLKNIYSGCFGGLDSLHTLKLSRLKTVTFFDESIFDPLKKLEVLEAYDSYGFTQQVVNSVRSLHGLRNLRELNIMHNNLVNLRSDFASFFPQLKIIKMSGNNWHCDKNILWLMHWIKRSEVQFYRSYSIRCATPENMQFKPIMMLEDSEFVVPTSPSYRTYTESKQATSTSVPVFLVSFNITTTTAAATTKSVAALENRPSVDVVNYTNIPNGEITKVGSTLTSYENEMLPSMTTERTPVVSAPTTTEAVRRVLDRHSSVTKPFTASITNVTSTTATAHLDRPVHDFASKAATTVVTAAVTSTKSVNASVLTNPLRAQSTFHPQLELEIAPSHQHVILITALVITCGIAFLLLVSGTVLSAYRHRKLVLGGKVCPMRRSSSISYHPQKDEVSIVTVSEGTVGLKTATHHGLGNKLYFVMESTDKLCDPVKEAFPEMDYYDLIPEQIKDRHSYGT